MLCTLYPSGHLSRTSGGRRASDAKAVIVTLSRMHENGSVLLAVIDWFSYEVRRTVWFLSRLAAYKVPKAVSPDAAMEMGNPNDLVCKVATQGIVWHLIPMAYGNERPTSMVKRVVRLLLGWSHVSLNPSLSFTPVSPIQSKSPTWAAARDWEGPTDCVGGDPPGSAVQGPHAAWQDLDLGTDKSDVERAGLNLFASDDKTCEGHFRKPRTLLIPWVFFVCYTYCRLVWGCWSRVWDLDTFWNRQSFEIKKLDGRL